MNTTKLLTIGLMILGLFGLSGMATAVTIADGNDGVNFAGEALTATWTGSALYTYVWVTSDAGNLSNDSAYCIGNSSAGMQLSYVTSYVLNTSNDCTTAGTYFVYVNNTNTATSPAISSGFENTYFGLNTFTVDVLPDYNTFGVLQGDNATVIIATEGPLPGATRVGATFAVSTTETGATAVLVSADSTTGNVTYKIPTSTTAGTYNVTVTSGAAKDTGFYAVRAFNIKAYDRTVSTNVTNRVVLESLDENDAAANFSSSSASDVTFTLVISGLTDNVWNGGSQTVNVVFPTLTNTTTVNVYLATGATAGTATITATCANFTATDAVNYSVVAAGQNVTITATKLNGTAATSFDIDDNVTIEGWINDDAATVNINITNGSAVVQQITGINASTGGAWTTTWNTNDVDIVNAGTFTILAWKNGSVNNSENATQDITVNDAIAISSATSTYNGANLTDSVYADGTLTINGTSSRLISTVTVNVSNAAGYNSGAISASLVNGTFGTTWAATGITAAGTYTVTVTDGIITATKTITVSNSLAVNAPANGPTGSNVTICGTSSRANSTVIYLTATDGIVQVMASGANATVSNYTWCYNWSTINVDTLAALEQGAYTITANDTISTATDTITLDTGSVSGAAAAPASIFLDETVNITGTSTFPAGTTVDVNITNCAGEQITTTTATVAADQTFLATFTPNTALAAIKSKTAIAAGSPVNLCAVANVSTKNTSTTFEIKDDLALTTVASAVSGDKVMLTGTSSRQNTTAITITVSLSNYAKTRSTTVSGGTFSEGTYYATTDGLITGTALPAGTYTINATDGVVSVTKTITLVTSGVIQITSPVEDQSITVGDNFMITGTSNRVNGTGVNITITGQNDTKLTATVNTLGVFNTTWNTTGYAAGYFYINVQHVVNGVLTDSSVTVRAVLTTQTTTTTTTTTTTEGNATTTTTLSNETCSMPGNSAPCGAVELTEVVSAINAWATGDLELGEVIDLINSWADPEKYPAE